MNNIDSLSLMNITSFLKTVDNMNFLRTCKKINTQLTKYGYVTDLTLYNDLTYYENIKKIRGKPLSIELIGFEDPLVWLPFHSDKIILNNCSECYENIVIFCMSNNYEIIIHNDDSLIILIKSQDQPQLQDI
jgi:hypothetical protein